MKKKTSASKDYIVHCKMTDLDESTRDLKIEVFRHLPRTASVKKSRDQCVGVRFAV